jgi:hypothetical protein
MSEQCTQEVSDFLAGQVFEPATDGKVDLNLSLINDNAYGLFELVTGRKLANDFGDTHGVLLEVGRTDRSGVNYKLVYFTNVYTERNSERYYTEDWGRTYDQYFTEENIIKILLDNKAQENDNYIELGIGVIELNRDKVRGWLSASGQQLSLHDAIGLFHPNNLSRSGENETGAFIEGSVGRKYDYISKNRTIRIVGDVKISAIANTVKESSSTSVTAGVNYYYQANKNSWAYKVGAKVLTRVHETDREPMNNVQLALGVGKGNYSFELIVTKIFAGHKQNYQDYNYDREATFTLQFTGKFGKKSIN